jgi:uncharacterized membrane protein
MRKLIHRKLQRHVDSAQIAGAIEAVERRTTGHILVLIAPHFWGNARRAAEHAFARYRLHHTKDRNAVLFFVVPSRREFVILGDAGIHARVGQEYWDRLSSTLAKTIQTGSLSEGLIAAINQVGDQLAIHFPRRGES